MELRICHLYPDVLNLYGDRGNILCMEQRLRWREIKAVTTQVPIGEPLDAPPAGGRVPCVRPRHRGRRPGALQPDAGYLCGRQQGADRGPAVSRTQVLTTDNALTSVSEVRINKIYPA